MQTNARTSKRDSLLNIWVIYERAAQVRRLPSITTTRFLHRNRICEIRQASRFGQSHKPNLSQAELFDEYHHNRGDHNFRTDSTVRLGKGWLKVKCTDRRSRPRPPCVTCCWNSPRSPRVRRVRFLAVSGLLSKNRAATIFH